MHVFNASFPLSSKTTWLPLASDAKRCKVSSVCVCAAVTWAAGWAGVKLSLNQVPVKTMGTAPSRCLVEKTYAPLIFRTATYVHRKLTTVASTRTVYCLVWRVLGRVVTCFHLGDSINNLHWKLAQTPACLGRGVIYQYHTRFIQVVESLQRFTAPSRSSRWIRGCLSYLAEEMDLNALHPTISLGTME